MRYCHNAAKATKKLGWLYRTVCRLQRKALTPEAMANRLALEIGEKLISHENIYRWVYEDWQNGSRLHTHMVRV